jgi:hypothetical protein
MPYKAVICVPRTGIEDDERVLGREILDRLNRWRAPRGPAQVHDYVVDADVETHAIIMHWSSA